MLDRLLKLIVALTLLLFLLQALSGVLVRSVQVMLQNLLGTMGTVGGFLGHVVGALVVLSFLIGLLVRGFRFAANRDPRGAREQASRDRAVRQRVRRPAEGVPPIDSRAEVMEDPDPAIGEEERG